MKSLLSIAIAILTLVAVLLVILLSKPSAPAGDAGGAVAPVTVPDAQLGARVEELAEENRALRDRIAMLENRPAPVTRVPVLDGLVSQEEFTAFQEEVRDALGTTAPETSVGDPGLRDQVALVLSEIRKGESVDKARSGLEQSAERIDATMGKVDEWLELSPDQSEAMRSALLARYERDAELVRLWEAGEDEEILGEIKTTNRADHLDEVSRFLTPDQFDRYFNRGGGGK